MRRIVRQANVESDGTTLTSADYRYDDSGQRIALIEATGARTTFGHDPTNQLTSEHRTGPDAYRKTYTYDPVGNRLLKNEDGSRTS